MECGPTRRRMARLIGTVAGIIGVCSVCQKPAPVGTANEIVVVASSEVWAALEDEIVTALEPRTFTVRDERILHVAYVAPADVASTELRRMRRILLIGSPGEPLIEEALAGREADGLTPPTVLLLPDVWVKNQRVIVALLPEAADPRVLESLLPRIADAYLRQFEEHIRRGMAVIPRNEQFAERLRQRIGVSLAIPLTYRSEQPVPGVFVFQQEEQGLTPVVRTIAIDSRARDAVDWTTEAAESWRTELAERSNQPPHVTETLPQRSLQGRLAGQPTIQIRGVWSSRPGEWPSAGPFVARMVECADRVFLIDAWLYAPVDEKYEYMYQLDRILDTFRCPADPQAPRS